MDPLSIFDRARNALAEIQISEVLKERLEFAIDKGAAAETKIAELRAEIADFKAELKIAKRESEEKKAEIEAIKKEHEEEIVVLDSLVFKRGKRTIGKWVSFCPVCDLPLSVNPDRSYAVQCLGSRKCDWYYGQKLDRYEQVLSELPK